MNPKHTPTPAVIEGVRLERWVNSVWDDVRFRILGVLVPKRLMEDPLSTLILSQIERRVNAHDALLAAAEEALQWIESKTPGIVIDAKDSLRIAIAKSGGKIT